MFSLGVVPSTRMDGLLRRLNGFGFPLLAAASGVGVWAVFGCAEAVASPSFALDKDRSDFELLPTGLRVIEGSISLN